MSAELTRREANAEVARLRTALEAIRDGAAAGTPGETFRQFVRRTASTALRDQQWYERARR